MGKTIRICLAMGGGVALGTFSGSGLTESLKLLLVYGKIKENGDVISIDKIIIDGMSGASAGAISLAIMLRSLVDYESILNLKLDETDGYTGNLAQKKQQVKQKIADQYYHKNIDDIPANKLEQLVALQVSQDLQYKIWVDKVNSLDLLGDKKNKGYKQNFEEPFGLLERSYLEDLTKDYLLPNTNEINPLNIQVLNPDRVIFACSLTNLLPMTLGIDKTKSNSSHNKNLMKSIASSTHTELRIIDFVFNEEAIEDKPTDSRWMRIGTTDSGENPTRLNITSKNAWAMLASSALACGAFPIGFPPVTLKRYRSEYDILTCNSPNNISDNLKGLNKYHISEGDLYSKWPDSFFNIASQINEQENLLENSFFDEEEDNKLDYTSFNFPYVDGGTFNNEPIKEAFRIASFVDYNRDTSEEERLILFVDPIVRKEDYKSFNLSSFCPVKTSDDYTVNIKGEISKLAGIGGEILGALRTQGSIKEGDKIHDVSESLSLKGKLNDYLGSVSSVAYSEDLLETSFKKIQFHLINNIISEGTRSPIDYFFHKLNNEIVNSKVVKADLSQIITFYKEWLIDKNQFKDHSLGEFNTAFKFYINNNITDNNSKQVLATTLFKIIIDISLGTAGKNSEARKRAILPINAKNEIIDLPGGELAAFGGFTSKESRKYAFEYAKLSTVFSFKETDNLADSTIYFPKDQSSELEKQLQENLRSYTIYSSESKYSNEIYSNLLKPTVQRIINMFASKTVNLITGSNLLFVGLGAGITSIFGGISQVLKPSIKKRIENKIKGLSDDVNYYKHTPIIVRIISDQKIEISKKLFGIGKKFIKLSDTKGKDVKMKINDTFSLKGDKHQLVFQVYLSKKGVEGNNANFSLTTQKKVRLPFIDPLLDSTQWREALEGEQNIEIKSILLKKRHSIDLSKLKNKNQTLFYSILNSEYHINPILEYNLEADTWSFIENTKSLDKQLIEAF